MNYHNHAMKKVIKKLTKNFAVSIMRCTFAA